MSGWLAPVVTLGKRVPALAMGRAPRSLASDIDAVKATLTDVIAAHDSMDMPQDVWSDLADAHHYLTAAGAHLARSQAALVVVDDE